MKQEQVEAKTRPQGINCKSYCVLTLRGSAEKRCTADGLRSLSELVGAQTQIDSESSGYKEDVGCDSPPPTLSDPLRAISIFLNSFRQF